MTRFLSLFAAECQASRLSDNDAQRRRDTILLGEP